MATVSKMSINLLPQEILAERRQGSKLSILNKLSIGLLVLMVFLSSSTVALKLSQNKQLQTTQDNLVHAQTAANSLQPRAVQVASLKQRLGTVQSLEGKDAKIKAIFNLIAALTPADIRVADLNVDANGQMTMAATTQSLSSFGTLIAALKDKGKTSGLIAKVELDGLSIGRDSTYRFGLKIAQK